MKAGRTGSGKENPRQWTGGRIAVGQVVATGVGGQVFVGSGRGRGLGADGEKIASAAAQTGVQFPPV